ncbi:MAG: putative rane protein [Herbinix sp.]|jgi:D-alanyl-D-alanine carboxypeptidase (penicillin-binding protein 5/6)|nr:putative rane protein [Herbinix sp.]
MSNMKRLILSISGSIAILSHIITFSSQDFNNLLQNTNQVLHQETFDTLQITTSFSSSDYTTVMDNSRTLRSYSAADPNSSELSTQGIEIAGNTYNDRDVVQILSSNQTSKEKTDQKIELIYDCNSIDYMSYIPELEYNDEIQTVLDIENPDIDLTASSAMLLDASTGEVLYYKDPILPVFPASTAKILSSLVALDFCKLEEEVKIGDEITLIASDSSKANIRKGQVLTVSNLLHGMLLPSGNDAAYAMAAYVGRKSLKNKKASKERAITEFARLMNDKAKELGAMQSHFVTPDGYDAIGQYTTAYDMSRIALEAANSKTIINITKKSTLTVTFVSGEKYTWKNTNSLIKKGGPWYNANVVGLKTGTTTMAGRCLLAVASNEDDTVVCVIMDSTSEGRWRDATELLQYGLQVLQ